MTVAVTGALLFAGIGTDIASDISSAQPVLPPTLPIPGLATGSLGAQPIQFSPPPGSAASRTFGTSAAPPPAMPPPTSGT